MGAAIFNLIMGLVALVGGLSGRLTLLGTESSLALSLLGVAITGLGVYQLFKARKR